MTCEAFLEQADAFVDGSLEADRQAEAAAHLDRCPRCASHVRVLRQSRATARVLPPVADSVRTSGSRRPAAEVPLPMGTGHARGRRGWPRLALPQSWAGLALVLMVMLALGTTAILLVNRPAPPAAPTADALAEGADVRSDDLAVHIEEELAAAATHYERAIAGLEQVASLSDAPLDPEVVATLRRNLALIDQAIEESQAALRADPGSRLAQESLLEAFRRKVALLLDTVALINEMRKGDPAGAARVVEGLGKP